MLRLLLLLLKLLQALSLNFSFELDKALKFLLFGLFRRGRSGCNFLLFINKVNDRVWVHLLRLERRHWHDWRRLVVRNPDCTSWI